jgi:hypothetical protein
MAYSTGSLWVRVLIFCLAASIGIPVYAAQPASRPSMDLSSTAATVSAAPLLSHQHPVTILVGGKNLTVSPSSLLTPAEMVAVRQVLTSHHQSLVLGTGGAAVSGLMNLTSFGSSFSNLVIPGQVKVLDSAARPLLVTADFTDSGSLIGVGGGRTFQLSAGDISVLTGGSINTLGGINLSIQSASNINNYGTISSSGRMLLSAAGNISNHAGATISSVQSMSLLSGAGQITNAGTISSAAGNINFATPSPADLFINNNGGQVAALLGNINVRNASFTGDNETQIDGGTFSAKAINLYGGSGTIDTDVDAFNGTVNVSSGCAHIWSAGAIDMGTVDLTGDPSFVSTAGSLNISTNNIFHGQDLAFLASDNITASSNVKTIDVSSTTGSGGTLSMVAGYDMNIMNGPPNPDGSLPVGATATLTAISATGGNITLPGVTLKTGSTFGGASGGSVLLAAANNGIFGGNITVGGIDTSAPKGTAGSVTILAPTVISIGTKATTQAIKMTGLTGGLLAIRGTTPVYVIAPVFDDTGALTAGAFSASPIAATSVVNVTGKVDSSGTTGNGGNMLVNASNGLNFTGPITSSTMSGQGGTMLFESLSAPIIIKGNITAVGTAATGHGGALHLDTQSTIDVFGNIDLHGGAGSGGILTGILLLSDRQTYHGSINTSATSLTGNGGGVFISSGPNFTANVEVLKGINATGAAGGGTVTLTSTGGNIIVGFNSEVVSQLPLTNTKGGVDTSSTGGQAGGLNLTTGGESVFVGGNLKATSGVDGLPAVMMLNSTNEFRVDGKIDASATKSTAVAGHITINSAAIETGAITDNGSGGVVSAACLAGNLLINGNVSVVAPKNAANASSVSLTVVGNVDILGNVDVSNGSTFGSNLTIDNFGSSTAAFINIKGNVVGNGLTSTSPGSTLLLLSQTGVNVGGTISSMGGNFGGFVSLQSLDGGVTVGKGVTANGLPNATTFGGFAGTVQMTGNAITVGGSVTATGGMSTGNFNGGSGGQVLLTTTADPGTFSSIGLVLVNGAVDVRGGNTTSKAMSGGIGGHVALDGATVKVMAKSAGGASVNSSGGTNGNKVQANGGGIAIATTGLQDLPTNFDLTSSKQTEVALPGGVFDVGSAKFNGTAGNLVVNSNIVSSTSLSSPFNQLNIFVTPGIKSAQILEGGVLKTIDSLNGIGSKAPRTMVTPGEATALFIATHALGPQGFGLSVNGVIPFGVIGSNVKPIPAFEFNRPYSTFKLHTAGGTIFWLDLTSTHPTANIDISHAVNPTISVGIFLGDTTASVASKELNFNVGSQKLTLSSAPIGGITDLSATQKTSVSFSSNSTLNIIDNTSMSCDNFFMLTKGGNATLLMGEGSGITTNGLLEIYTGTGSILSGTINVQSTAVNNLPVINQSNIGLDGGTITWGKHGVGPAAFTGPSSLGASLFQLEATKSLSFYSPSDIDFGRGSVLSGGALNLGAALGIHVGSAFSGNEVEAVGSLSLMAGSNIQLINASTFTSGKDMLLQSLNTVADDGVNGNTMTSGGALNIIGVQGINFTSSPNNFTSSKDMHVACQTGGVIWAGNATSGGALTAGSLPAQNLVNSSILDVSGNKTSVGNMAMDAGAASVLTTLGGFMSSTGGTFSFIGPSGLGNLTALGTSISSAKALTITSTNGTDITLGILTHLVSGGLQNVNGALVGINQSSVKSAGSIKLNAAGNMTFGSNNLLITVGGDISVVSHNGNNTLGNGSTFVAFGGNVSLLASGNIVGGTSPGAGQAGNTIEALCLITGTKTSGGVVEVQSGTTTSNASAYRQVALANSGFLFDDAAQSALVTNLFVTGSQTTGQFGMNQGAGSVMLTNTGALANDIVLLAGSNAKINPVILIHANGGNTISLDSVKILSITAISDRSLIDQSDDVVIDSDEVEPSDAEVTAFNR